MVSLRRTILLPLACILIINTPLIAHSEEVGDLLRRDIFTEKNGRFVSDRTLRCRIPFGAPVYLKHYIEAPTDLISRDNAVAVSTHMHIINRVVMASMLDPDKTPVEAMSHILCWPSENREAELDFTIKVIMTREGVRIETTDNRSGDTSIENFTWSQVLGSETE